MNIENIAVLGVPFDQNSSFLRGAAAAPLEIQSAFFSPSTNLWSENGMDLSDLPKWHILTELESVDPKEAFVRIENRIRVLLKQKRRIVALGGDHSITWPVLRGYRDTYPELTILHLDAHPDLYDTFEGNRYSHACPFARIMEENLAKRLVQVGIRTMTGHQLDQAKRFGVEIIEMKEIRRAAKLAFTGPVYLTVDMDCLDPAFAPGVSHHEPGGMSVREILEIIQNLNGPLVGADIVEYHPARDLQNMTGMVAGKLLKEIIAKLVDGP